MQVRAARLDSTRRVDGGARDPWLAARRLLATSVSTLESVGHLRLDVRGLDGAALARARAERLRASMARLSDENGYDVRRSGAPWPDGPALICANHLSWIDVPVLLGQIAAVPLAKQEVARWPVIGAHARGLGVIFVKRGDPFSGAVALRSAQRVLAHGVPVLAFPEGTTTDGRSPLLPFRRGLFGLAQLARVPIVPVALRYHELDRVWHGASSLLPHFLRVAASPRTVVDVRVGAPITPTSGQRAEELASAARAAVDRLLGRPK